MFDERSFDTRSFDARSWLLGLVVETLRYVRWRLVEWFQPRRLMQLLGLLRLVEWPAPSRLISWSRFSREIQIEEEGEMQTVIEYEIDHEEVDDLGFSYGADLLDGETVSAFSVTAEVHEGRDSSPAAVLIGSAQNNTATQYVTQRVKGTMPDVAYKLRAKITLSSGRVLIKPVVLRVVRY